MLRNYREAREEEGFTLIELLVVIIIIGILAAIAIPAFLGQRERARRSAVQSDLRNLAVAMETYFTDNGFYSDTVGALEFNASDNVTVAIVGADASQWCASATMDGLPADDGGAWYFDSDADESTDGYVQLHPASDGACN